MCGIVAMIARKPIGFIHADMDIMQNLLVLDTVRGEDSTGVFAVDRNKNINYMKVASHPFNLFACEDWNKLRNKTVQAGRIMVGHNRKATQGSINSANAHPFHEGNIIMVHNGTLRGNHKKDFADVDVDSHAVCHAFNEKGIENVIPTIDGAFAFVGWNIETGNLFAIRNTERPLFLANTEDVSYLVSEPWMVYAAAGRLNRKIIDCVELKAGDLYEFDHMTGKVTTKTLELYKTPHSNFNNDNWEGWARGRDGVWTKDTDPLTNDRPPLPKKQSGGLTVVPKSQPANTEVGPKVTDSVLPSLVGFNHLVNEDFPKSSQVIFKLTQLKVSGDQKYCTGTGKIIEKDKPMIDVIAHIVHDFPPSALAQFIGQPLAGYVAVYMNPTNGGPTVYVRGVHRIDQVKIHNGEIPKDEWARVVDDCKCKKCQAQIYDEEAEFTIVTRATGNALQVVCADCVEDQLPNGEMKNAFNQRRLASLQNAESVSKELARIASGSTSAPGSSTLQ